jgi:hypothetical protein
MNPIRHAVAFDLRIGLQEVNFRRKIGAFLSTRMGIIFATNFVNSKVLLLVTFITFRSTKIWHIGEHRRPGLGYS